MKIRKPKAEGRKKAEIRSPKSGPLRVNFLAFRISGLGLRSAVGFRPSDFGS